MRRCHISHQYGVGCQVAAVPTHFSSGELASVGRGLGKKSTAVLSSEEGVEMSPSASGKKSHQAAQLDKEGAPRPLTSPPRATAFSTSNAGSYIAHVGRQGTLSHIIKHPLASQGSRRGVFSRNPCHFLNASNATEYIGKSLPLP